MEFEEVLETRQSFHSFTDEKVEDSEIEAAVEVARRAPSAWNIQPWKLIVLSSDDQKQKAVETSYGQEWMLDADRILVVAGDLEFSGIDRAFEDMVEKGYKSKEGSQSEKEMVESYRDKDFDWKELELTSNCCFFASALIEALWEREIGSCPVKGFDQKDLQDELDLDELYPILLVPIGYPDEEKEKKYRKEVSELVRFP